MKIRCVIETGPSPTYFRFFCWKLKTHSEHTRTHAQAFGWVKKAEISNGRWVMFGLLVGMMTEYATGKSFTDQVAITLTYMGFANFDV